MTRHVSLQFTRTEALALHALTDRSAELFFGVVGGDKDYDPSCWTKEDAARACDKLRAAILGEEIPEVLTWSAHFQQLISDSNEEYSVANLDTKE